MMVMMTMMVMKNHDAGGALVLLYYWPLSCFFSIYLFNCASISAFCILFFVCLYSHAAKYKETNT